MSASKHGEANSASGDEVFYNLSIDKVLEKFDVSSQGLTDKEATDRLAKYGKNAIEEAKKVSRLAKFLSNFVHLFAILLWIGGVLAFISKTPEIGYAIFAVIFINAFFSYWQEYKAEKATEALKKMLPAKARVLRSGEQKEILAEELVPGDIMLLSEGDNISADGRVIEQFELATNNSTLTGESEPVKRTSDPILDEKISPTEAPNLVFAGTSVAAGSGRAVVTATGMKTEFGKIAKLTQTVVSEKSPLQIQMQRITKLVAILAVGMGIGFFFIGRSAGLALDASFVFAVGIIVANVPEGLLPTVTLGLAMGVQRMAKRHALIKKLSSVETLGSTTVICTDKTGTLTQNEMTVQKIWIQGKNITVTGAGYEPKGEFLIDGKPIDQQTHQFLTLLARSASFCNSAKLLSPKDENGWRVLGDPTEAALLVAARKLGFDYDQEMIASPRIYELPFESKRKRMSTIHAEQGKMVAYVKGAPKEVLDLCTKIVSSEGIKEITDKDRQAIINQNDQFARSALRVLAIAYRDLPKMSDYKVETVEKDLVFIGLVAMMDPPRREVTQAVKQCATSGIRVIMITGDYGLTAESIARRIGIVKKGVRIVTGAELDGMDDSKLSEIIYGGDVIFARVAPEHKMRVVSVLKDHGEVVAVTGDGVNDAPALKKADIGVAMGIAGTDVAKEAADMILTDDNFASIVHAVEEGRAVYDNIRRFVTYIFASNIPEIVPFILMVIFKLPLPLTVMQILAIDLGTDMLPALALGTEKPEPEIMNRPPRPAKERLLNLPLLIKAYFFLGPLEAAAAMAAFFYAFASHGIGASGVVAMGKQPVAVYQQNIVYLQATTMAHMTIMSTQIGNGYANRTKRSSIFQVGFFSNRFYVVGVISEILLGFVLVYFPLFQKWFGEVALSLKDWLFIFAWSPVVLVADELRKYFVRRLNLK